MVETGDYWLSKEVAAACVQALATVGAVFVAYHFGILQLKRQTRIQVAQDLRKRQADALQHAWGLLRCLSPTENGDSLLCYQQAQTGERQYFIHLVRAQVFVFEALPTAFYVHGAGLHWDRELKDKLFKARSLVYGFLLKNEQAHAPLAQAMPTPALRAVQNPMLAQELEQLHAELLKLLRQHMKSIYQVDF